jgi:hypothetical protein
MFKKLPPLKSGPAFGAVMPNLELIHILKTKNSYKNIQT